MIGLCQDDIEPHNRILIFFCSRFGAKTTNLILKITCFTTVRLVGADNMESFGTGRVEVFYKGTWDPVCGESYSDDIWDLKHANIICRQLGFPGALVFRTVTATVGKNSSDQTKNWFKARGCVGNETSLTMCHRSGWSSYCSNNRGAHVECIAGD